jgi:ElaB/YqjD/DUF883 family membrane-anchored ribosome-binding protein
MHSDSKAASGGQSSAQRGAGINRLQESASGLKQNIQDMGSAARDTAQEQYEHVRDTAQEQYERFRDTAQEQYEQLRDTAAEYAEQGRAKYEEIEQSLETQIRDQPLKSMLIACGIGFVLGLFLRR